MVGDLGPRPHNSCRFLLVLFVAHFVRKVKKGAQPSSIFFRVSNKKYIALTGNNYVVAALDFAQFFFGIREYFNQILVHLARVHSVD
jgi:hypothetical protein